MVFYYFNPLLYYNIGINCARNSIKLVLCRTSKRNTWNRTRGNNTQTELLYNNVNKELHLQELHSSARASRNSQKCFEIFLHETFLLRQSTCLSSLWLCISMLHFRYSFRYCIIVPQITVLIQPDKQRVVRVFSVTQGDMLQRPAANRQLGGGLMSGPGYGDLCLKNLRA